VKKKRPAFLNLADWATFVDQYSKADDRSCGILFVSYLDNCVTEALLTHIKYKEDCEKELLRESGPLGSLFARVELLWSLGGLDATVRHDLHSLRRVRNVFAHQMNVMHFSEEPIKSWCKDLKLPPDLKGISNKLHPALTHPERLRFIISGALSASWLEKHARDNAKA
jgi:DNA-binding MltR family transcriptional regulator